MSRDFAAVEVSLEYFDMNSDPSFFGVADGMIAAIVTYALMGQDDRVQELIVATRKSIDDLAEEMGLNPLEHQSALTLALLAALDGDADEAERLIRLYYRNAGADRAGRSLTRGFVCQVVGLAEAAEAAAQCIRDGLGEPSAIIHFIEPFLPFYDGIRETPEFIALVEELDY